MRRRSTLISILGAIFTTALLARPATAAPSAEELVAQVKAAHQQITKYHNVIQLRMERTMGGQKQSQTAEATVAFDRESDRLLFNGPGTRLVVADGKLQLKLDGVADHYMQTPLKKPIEFEALVKHAPLLMEPLPEPDIAFLFAEDPIAALAAGGTMGLPPGAQAGPGADKAAERRVQSLRALDPAEDGEGPRLQMEIALGTLTLTIDPETRLIKKSVIAVSPERTRGAKITFQYTYGISTGKEALKPDMFAFESGEREKVDTFMALVEIARQGPGQALVGKKAPAFEVEKLSGGKFSMEKDASEVVVLDFWAKWCAPCLVAMPQIQEVHEWAQENHGDRVSIYAVNLQDDKSTVASYWSDKGYTIPVLLDKTGQVGSAYSAPPIPQTFVIHNGKVAKVYLGSSPQIAQTLKDEINSLLKKNQGEDQADADGDAE